MSYLSFYKKLFTKIYVTSEIRNHPDVVRVLNELDDIPLYIINSKDEILIQNLHQHTLFINSPKGSIAGRCPGSKGHLCCNYLTIDLYVGCTIGCSYCIMKSYLNFSPITVNVKVKKSISQVLKFARDNPHSTIRVGTGEVGDSLLYDPLFKFSEMFIKAFSKTRNIFFEMKTKTDFVDHLLDIKDKGNAVIGFSLNPPEIAKKEEPYGARLEERIEAARKAAASGYNISFHFDPIFRFPGWERAYKKVIQKLKFILGNKIVWISLGTFRYTPTLREKIDSRWFLYDEFVPCLDNKFRYIQKIRSGIYKTMVAEIRNIHPEVPVYMCMESPAVWNKTFGKIPGKINNLCVIFKPVKVLCYE